MQKHWYEPEFAIFIKWMSKENAHWVFVFFFFSLIKEREAAAKMFKKKKGQQQPQQAQQQTKTPNGTSKTFVPGENLQQHSRLPSTGPSKKEAAAIKVIVFKITTVELIFRIESA